MGWWSQCEGHCFSKYKNDFQTFTHKRLHRFKYVLDTGETSQSIGKVWYWDWWGQGQGHHDQR